jgi:hypothetical protein
MNTIIYESRKNGRVLSRARLTTQSPCSSYGIPVLELRYDGKTHTFGWSDILPSGLTGAQFVRLAPNDASNHIPDSSDRRAAIEVALENITAMGL